VFEHTNVSEKESLLVDESTSGGGTSINYDSNKSEVSLNISGAAEASKVVIRQSKIRSSSSVNKSYTAVCCGIIGGSSVGYTKRIGLFDDNNGMFFESDNTDFNVVVRSSTTGSVVDTKVSQSSWNLDKMDGTGNSGLNIDRTLVQTFIIDYSIGGLIRFGFMVKGEPIYCHEIGSSNLGLTLNMSSISLPIRFEIRADSSQATDESVIELFSSIIEEGEDKRELVSVSRRATSLSVSNSSDFHNVISLRLNQGFLGSKIFAESISLISTSSVTYAWYLVLNPSISTGSFTWFRVGDHSIDYSTSSVTLVPTNSNTLASGVGSSSNTLKEKITEYINEHVAIGSKIDGTQDVVTLCVQKLSGTTSTYYGSINLRETK
jgi:hypothetical protein